MSTRPRITFDERGFCNACQWMEEKQKLNWPEREKYLKKILNETKKNKKGNYDCIVPCSGGKDGSYVAYQLRDKYEMNVLTVTVRPPLELDVGEKNLKNFTKTKDNFEHLHITTNNKSMQKINKLGFIEKGSPYYGWIVTVFTSIIRTALAHKIDLVFYGEDGEIEYGGSTQNKNNPIFDFKYIVKNYFEGDHQKICKKSGLSKNELHHFTLDEKEFKKNNLKLTHWGYYEPWDPYRNYLFVKEKYTFQETETANVGTFTNFAQNDQSIFALHTYLMYLKFGFGRATQDAGIEIRRGAMTREQGKNLVNLYDNQYPDKFESLYLDYYQMTKDEFQNVLDNHANKDLFEKKNGRWSPKFKIS